MNPLTDILQRCHQRHKEPLRQRKTVLTPTLYGRDYPYQFAVYCAHRYSVLLADLEQAAVSFMPIGRAPEHDQGPKDFGGDRFSKRQGIKDWRIRRWRSSWGIQVYTGTPSECEGAQWHDIEFKYEALCAAPDAVLTCVEALVNAVTNPLLTLSKEGGLRFSCRVPDYLHPHTKPESLYIYKHAPTSENPYQRDVYLEILGEAGYSRWDARYEMLLGNLLDPPIIHKGILFGPIEALRSELHEPAPSTEQEVKRVRTAAPLYLGSHRLNLAKEAFLKRCFSYVRRENNFHVWIPPDGDFDECHILLWEADDSVWLRASTPNAALPTDATRITDVWDNTGILAPTPSAGLPVPENILAVREERLSPLAIKRPPPMLQKSASEKSVYETPDGKVSEIQRIFDDGIRILGLITQTDTEKKYEAVSSVSDGGTICLNASPVLASAAEKYFQAQGMASVAHYKPRMYAWERVKDIPVAVRMANPFQHGNVCEDPERCDTLVEKGGNPRESICPNCPVYTECQQRGYLSQSATLQHAKAHIALTDQLFFDPRYGKIVEDILRAVDGTEKLCIIDEIHAPELFLKYALSRNVLEAWRVNWKGRVLGNFADALLNILDLKDKSRDDIARRIRATLPTFQWQAEELIWQMYHVNVQGTDVNTPMSMTQAIECGILDTTSVESIQNFPTVCRDPNWTYWHRLNYFFDAYTSDTDAPMLWDTETLHFWVPPILHPSIKRLLLISSTLSEQQLRKSFPDDKTAVAHVEPAPWLVGNQVFQMRTGTYPIETILDYDNTWDEVGLSETGLRFFERICAEIERDPSVNHGIVTYNNAVTHLTHIAKKENVCFIASHKATSGIEISETDFEAAEVLWIVGTPRWAPDIIWRRAQILFGNDAEPLCYEKETESDRYKDERVQRVYEKAVIGVLTQTVGRVKLHHLSGKKIVLMTSFPVPDITDRPETLLFDWADFEVAGSLDKLPEVIATRERFEAERAALTADSTRKEVERVLGCSSRQANRILKKFRGGRPFRVPFRDQILSHLSDGEKTTAALVAAIDGHPKAINNELTRLVETGEIIKVRRGMYALP